MSSTFVPRQCLFCNHLNPAGASFCNDCGSQLHLQPCNQCGAIDKRTAKFCYKCGARFTLSAPQEIESASPDNPLSDLSLPGAGISDEHGTAHESATQTTDTISHVMPPEVSTPLEIVYGNSVVAPTPADLPLTLSSAQPQQAHDALLAQGSAVTAASHPAWRLTVSALLLLSAVVAYYFYQGQSAQPEPKQDGVSLSSSTAGQIPSAGTAPSPLPAPARAALAPAATHPQVAASTTDLNGKLTLAPPGAGNATTTTMKSSPAPDAEARPLQTPQSLKDCPEAVAVLGLCNQRIDKEQ